jgi:hypothetical protein
VNAESSSDPKRTRLLHETKSMLPPRESDVAATLLFLGSLGFSNFCLYWCAAVGFRVGIE